MMRTMTFDWKLATIPVVAAVIGYATNWLAVPMKVTLIERVKRRLPTRIDALVASTPV